MKIFSLSKSDMQSLAVGKEVQGIAIRAHWGFVQPAKGGPISYDFLRNESERAKAMGHEYSIRVTTGQRGCPDWAMGLLPWNDKVVKAKVALYFFLFQHFRDAAYIGCSVCPDETDDWHLAGEPRPPGSRLVNITKLYLGALADKASVTIGAPVLYSDPVVEEINAHGAIGAMHKFSTRSPMWPGNGQYTALRDCKRKGAQALMNAEAGQMTVMGQIDPRQALAGTMRVAESYKAEYFEVYESDVMRGIL